MTARVFDDFVCKAEKMLLMRMCFATVITFFVRLYYNNSGKSEQIPTYKD